MRRGASKILARARVRIQPREGATRKHCGSARGYNHGRARRASIAGSTHQKHANAYKREHAFSYPPMIHRAAPTMPAPRASLPVARPAGRVSMAGRRGWRACGARSAYHSRSPKARRAAQERPRKAGGGAAPRAPQRASPEASEAGAPGRGARAEQAIEPQREAAEIAGTAIARRVSGPGPATQSQPGNAAAPKGPTRSLSRHAAREKLRGRTAERRGPDQGATSGAGSRRNAGPG